MSDWISATIIDDDLDQNGLGLDQKGLDLQQKIKDLEQKVKELEANQVKIKKPRKYTKKTKVETTNDTKNDTKNELEQPVVNIIPECLLKKFYHSELNIMEVGCDEAGRGPMFG